MLGESFRDADEVRGHGTPTRWVSYERSGGHYDQSYETLIIHSWGERGLEVGMGETSRKKQPLSLQFPVCLERLGAVGFFFFSFKGIPLGKHLKGNHSIQVEARLKT